MAQKTGSGIFFDSSPFTNKKNRGQFTKLPTKLTSEPGSSLRNLVTINNNEAYMAHNPIIGNNSVILKPGGVLILV